MARFGPVALGVLAAVAAAAAIMVAFHDKFWWPPDDGAYAYVAQRLLHGDVLNGDIQDVHAGYVHFIHAAAMALFGQDLLSLRYPLALLTVAQAAIAYLLLLPRGRLVAFVAALIAASLSWVLFINPSANWYALTMAFVLVAALAWSKPGDARREALVGALVAAAFLLRQPSGVFLAMGALAWLLVEPRASSHGPPRLARALIAVMGVGLLSYLIGKQSLAAAVMFGLWPAAILVVAWRKATLADAPCLKTLVNLALGAVAVACPLVIYHLHHGTLTSWLSDAVGAAFVLTSLDFISEVSYAHLFLRGVALATEADLRGLASLLFWYLLLLAPMALGVLCLGRAAAIDSIARLGPLPVVAAFFSLISSHYQIPIYLTYSSALTLVAIASFAEIRRHRILVATIGAGLCATALALHAAQPLTRGIDGILLGRTLKLDAVEGLPRAAVAMERQEQRDYAEILDLIARHSKADETILALPFSPEFYFLADRRSPLRYFIAPLGLVTESDYARALAALRREPPAVVIFRREDKYNSPLTLRLVDRIKREYVTIRSVAGFDVLVRQGGSGHEPRP